VAAVLPREEIGETIGRYAMSARRQQDLEDLLRAAAAEIPRAQHSGALDRERPEQPNQQTLSMFVFFTHSHRRSGDQVQSPHGHGRYSQCAPRARGSSRGPTPCLSLLWLGLCPLGKLVVEVVDDIGRQGADLAQVRAAHGR
jgi:hypothetical protein